MTEHELHDLLTALRLLGPDPSQVEVHAAHDGIPAAVRSAMGAFANTAGGTIVLGLDPSSGFAACGIHDPSSVVAQLEQMATSELEPPVPVLATVHEVDDRSIIVVQVPELPPAAKPCHLRGAGPVRGTLVRTEDGNRLLSAYELHLVLAERSPRGDDEAPLAPHATGVLDDVAVRRYCEQVRSTQPALERATDLEVLRRTRVLVPNPKEGDDVTVAGLLALGSYPQEHLPGMAITITWHGDEARTRRCEGSVPMMVQHALRELGRSTLRRRLMTQHGLIEVPQHADDVVREVLVNALVHRDCSAAAWNLAVEVHVHDDRLEVRSPGGTFGTLDEQQDRSPIGRSRNPRLQRILSDVATGDGQALVQGCRAGLGRIAASRGVTNQPAARLENRIGHFVVTLDGGDDLDDRTTTWFDEILPGGAHDHRRAALQILRSGRRLSAASYGAATGVDPEIAAEELQDLVTRGVLRRLGDERWGRLLLSPATNRASRDLARQPTPPKDRRQAVLDALGDEELSRSEIEQRTGMTGATVGRWLRTLRSEGVVEMIGDPGQRETTYQRSAVRRLPEHAATVRS